MLLLFYFLVQLLSAGLSSAFICPDGGYLYRDCSTCFSIEGDQQGGNFSTADDYCRLDGGSLLEIKNTMDLTRLQRYLEGIQERRGMWVGYLYNSKSVRVAADGGPASDVVLNNSNFASGREGGEEGTCIGIEAGKLFSAPCSNLFLFICQHHYDVPRVQLSHESGSVFFISRDQHTLRATVLGTKISSVEWRRNNAIIAQDRSEFSTSAAAVGDGVHNVSLVFVNFNASVIGGRYSLVVADPVGTFIIGTWHVQQAVLGGFVHPPRNLTVAVGQIAGFQCGTTSFSPPLQVTWFKDSAQLRTTDGDPRLHVTPETGTFFIRNVRPSDAGTYHCTVSNAAGVLNSEPALLSVVELPSILGDFRIEEIISPRSQSIQVGQTFVMDVLVASSSEKVTEIAVDERTSGYTSSFKYPVNEGFPVFEIQNVTIGQNGAFYFFRYFSLPDYATSKDQSVQLTVFAAASVDELVTSWDRMRSLDNFQSIPRGRDVTVGCRFSGTPTSSVEWYRDGVLINTGIATDLTASLSTLSLSNVQATSVYQCHVFNEHGSDIAMLFLCSQTPPDGVPGPVGFQVIPDTNSSLYVNWNEAVPLNTLPELLRYHISYRALPGGAEVTQTELSDGRSSVISGLLSNTEYEVSMSASSLVGSGATSSKTVATFANVPTEPIPAADISVRSSQDNTVIMVEWRPFVGSGRTSFPVVVYKLQYRLISQEVGKESNLTVPGDNLVGVVSGLVNADNYEVRVRIQIQSQRDPVQYQLGPWSAYIRVVGVFTTATPTTSENSVSTGLPLFIIILIVVGMAAIIAVAIGITILICCCFYHRRPDGIYSIPETGKSSSSKAVSFNFSAASNVYMEEDTTTANTSILSSQPKNEDVLTTTTSFTADNKPSDSHKVNIAVVDDSSVNITKNPLSNPDEWTEEFDHLTNLVTILEDTVSSMASLRRTSPFPDHPVSSCASPEPRSSSHSSPNTATYAPIGPLLITNEDATSRDILLQDSASQSVASQEAAISQSVATQDEQDDVSQSMGSQDGQDDVSRSMGSQDGRDGVPQSMGSQDGQDGVSTVNSSQDDDTTSEDNKSSQIMQVGHAKRANNFAPNMYTMMFNKDEEEKEEDEEMEVQVYDTNWVPSQHDTEPLPEYFLSTTSSPHSNTSSDINNPGQTKMASKGNRGDGIDFDANFIELLQYGESTDLHMV